MPERIGFGGGCHWCTEAVFQRLRGVVHVQQGWASGIDDPARFSESVIVQFDPEITSILELVTVHQHTHSCTSAHALRGRYRSAVYVDVDAQAPAVLSAIALNQPEFDAPIRTEVIRLGGFRENVERYRNYYRSNPERPFCRRFIEPKLAVVRGMEMRFRLLNPEADVEV